MDEDGVQLGGKRAAIQYAYRLREAASAANAETGEVDEKAVKQGGAKLTSSIIDL